MDWKKISTFAPLLSAAVVVGCILLSLSHYTPPVYEVMAEEVITEEIQSSDIGEKTEEEIKPEIEVKVAEGEFDLEDGIYRGTGNGFAGTITVSVEIKNKKIVAIDVLNVEGDDMAFFNRAKGVIDKIISSQNLDVDVVSGATYSSRGIINAVKNALTGEKDSNESPSIAVKSNTASVSVSYVDEPSAYRDGTYYGTGTGFGGPLAVMVNISGGKIVSIRITQHSDGSSYIQKASGLITGIIAAQSTNVDTVSGATYSSAGIIEAVRDALNQAAVQNTGGNNSNTANNTENNGGNSSALQGQTVPAGTIPYVDGIYYGTGEGYMGNITVAVVIQDKTIKAILITENEGDDDAFLERAKAVAVNVVNQQNTDVDVVTGATYSSRGILDAIKNALEEARKVTSGETETEKPDEIIDPDISGGESDEEEESNPSEEENSIYEDGEYTAQVICMPDENEDFEPYILSLKMEIQNDQIVSITEVQGDGDSANAPYIKRAANGTASIPGVLTQILEKNSTEEIDTVSRATCSSKAIIEACNMILEYAKCEPSEEISGEYEE
ncbi:MAG: FMN-binding protein [Oliverpabstia sp.]